MADMVIGDYDAAVAIDGATNYLLIQPGTSSVAYKKINRDVFLGVTGQPADISSVQNITNKTLDNTNTATLRDDRFTLQDSGDVTRQATFQLSGITAGNTRVMTFPDASTTLVGTGTTQTLTNKTLTSPAITGGTIDNSTISVDAIAEFSSGNGVTVDGMNIKDGKLNTNNSVVTANITDAAVTPAKLIAGTGSGWTMQSFTPTLANFTTGNGTVTGSYIQTGKIVYGEIYIACGTTTAFGTAMTFSLPVAANAKYGTRRLSPVGPITFLDSGTAIFVGTAVIDSSTTVAFVSVTGVGGTYATYTTTTGSVPFTIGAGDTIAIQFEYEAA